ncbi:MAG: hypothetical protein JWM09_825 [Francisellaceae bacterium]|nr:hypothetical protein [Francisellaceae bacterium]
MLPPPELIAPINNLGELLSFGEQYFLDNNLYFGHGTDNAWDEAVQLAFFVLNVKLDADLKILDTVLDNEQKKAVLSIFVERVKTRKPAAYLTGIAEFAGLKFYVNEQVIIPRSPIAELILNQFQPWLGNHEPTRMLDLCTGSGCLAILCALSFATTKVDAIDISEACIEVAHKNNQLHNTQSQVNIIQSNLFENLPKVQYDIIISNPPYVDKIDMEALPLEYLFEPVLALEAGEDGLDIIKQILKKAQQFLKPTGLLIVEVGNSSEALIKAYPQIPFIWLDFERGGEGVFLLEAKDL